MQYQGGMRLKGRRLLVLGWMAMLLLAGLAAPVSAAVPEQKENRLLAVKVNQNGSPAAVELQTESPVGFRYTAYDSYEPVRIVVDLPGMDVSAVKSPIKVTGSPLFEVRTSSFDLTSGKLGRVELLLSKETKYKIDTNDQGLTISFGQVSEKSAPPAKTAAPVPAGVAKAKPAQKKPAAKPEAGTGAKVIEKVKIGSGSTEFLANGKIGRFESFPLGNPPRLVVDIYGVRPGFSERSYRLADGFQMLRVGAASDKTRFVFDAAGSALPEHSVVEENQSLRVTWGPAKKRAAVQKDTAAPSETRPAAATQTKVEEAPRTLAKEPAKGTKVVEKAKSAPTPHVNIEAVDFKVDNGTSVLLITLSGPAEITDPKIDGKLVLFSIKNADISRALRRTIDASSFPSAVRLITPYLVAERNQRQEVRFAAELKGEVPYSLKKDGNKVLFTVENLSFAQPAPAPEKLPVTIAAAPPAAKTVAPGEQVSPALEVMPAAAAPPVAQGGVAKPTPPAPSALAEGGRAFTGERISLVFDDANIRNILQLIGEVSNLNILADDDVKGTITLRLIDVPWDQALDLILEIKGLDKLQKGNVVQIMPKEKLRNLRQSEMSAAKKEEELEAVVTEVIPVSYTSLANITAPVKDRLTAQGKITPDDRNKQIILTDIPARVGEIRQLIKVLDTPERQVMIEARIIEARSNFSRDLGVRWGLSYQNDSGGPNSIQNVNIGGGGSFLIEPPTAGGVGSAGLAAGLTFGRLLTDSTTLDLKISALESSGNGKVISTPRVTTLNGGKALISQGTKIPYTSVSDEGTETKFENAELKLEVQPVINPDNSVILDIKASNSSVGQVVPQASGGNALSIEEKKAETKVIVHDGETTVIGGIFVESEAKDQTGMPLLRSIPILGHLFQSTVKSDERRELLIFITPRILQ